MHRRKDCFIIPIHGYLMSARAIEALNLGAEAVSRERLRQSHSQTDCLHTGRVYVSK